MPSHYKKSENLNITKPLVLVVDDDPNQLKIISDILSIEELQPVCFTNARDSIEECKRYSINVAVIDLSLPDMEGLELLKELLVINPNIKVIINTGYASMETAIEAVNNEAFAYITKMGNVQELLAHVHRAFHSHLTKYNEELAREVSKRTSQLQRSNMELKYEISERKKMQEELIKARKLESLGILAGGIAHDFNNLLTAILGNISLTKLYSNTDDEIYKRLAEAENASMRARELTQQLLTFAKGGAPIKKVINVNDIVRESVNFTLRGSNIKCEFQFQDQMLLTEVDEGQLSQVINNLTLNSKQAMPDGGEIIVSTKYIMNGNLYVESLLIAKYAVIEIEDRGIGIPGNYINRVFDPYFTTKEDGHGLGLATSYSIVKKHDGIITVVSELGRGSKFTIYLPASDNINASSADVSNKKLIGSGKILVMDDEQGIRDVIEAILTKIGYKVDTVKNGFEALEYYKNALDISNPYDVVVLDLTIPGSKGGEETLKELYEIDPNVKAIVSSGYSNDPIMSDYKNYGFIGCVAKPYKPIELNEILTDIIESR